MVAENGAQSTGRDMPATAVAAESGGAPASSGRVIRPATGVLLDDRHFRLEDVGELTRALIAHSEGRLEELRRAGAALEERLRRSVEESRAKIQSALALTSELVEGEIRAARALGAQLRERGREEGLREGREQGFAEGQRSGFEKGYAEGLEAGLREGRRSGEEAIRKQVEEQLVGDAQGAAQSIVRLAAELDRAWRDVVGGAHRDLLRLALGVAEKIVRREVREDPDIIRDTLAVAIDRIADRRRLTIEMHPADHAILSEYLQELRERLSECTALRIVEREDLARGGCRVLSANSTIDLTIETQIEVLERTLASVGEGVA